VSIHPLDPDAGAPYEALRTQVARRAASGDLPAGHKLPTVRALAAELGVAAGTVARAYRELEADGVVVTEGRRGTFIASSAAATGTDARAAAASYVEAVRRLGLSRDEAGKLVAEAW